ncbi:uncharacterized protein BKA55DRAFT_686319 [Fusarium redolens]|uniref:Uncharacterized protein n=1 Tax=Fusarium redolens TaxID=48865 RepID=A0A9P9HQ38_FUSRE|nr:uncharacterized protein BKA55DRAFT_686319 [Fusarium redolens]KAH7260737.1 hypothetical protein BKA55DRAFT_686319 [Fusarium redolens]
MVQLFKDFQISKKPGFFTAEDMDSYDTSQPQVPIRCFGHVLNLPVNAFFEGDSSGIFDSTDNKDRLDIDTELRLLTEWRKYGSRLGRTDERPENRISEDDVLQHEDWLILTEILEILKVYIQYTKYFEGREPRFSEVISTVCCLQDHLKEMQKRYNEDLVGTPFETPQIDLEEPSFGSSDSAVSCIFVAGDESQMPLRSQRDVRLPARLQDFEVYISSQNEPPHSLEPIVSA